MGFCVKKRVTGRKKGPFYRDSRFFVQGQIKKEKGPFLDYDVHFL